VQKTLTRPRLAQRNEDVQNLFICNAVFYICDYEDYIHQNPVVEEIVENEEDYLYSSTRNIAGLKGLIELNEL
jgi:hypothetical protein